MRLKALTYNLTQPKWSTLDLWLNGFLVLLFFHFFKWGLVLLAIIVMVKGTRKLLTWLKG